MVPASSLVDSVFYSCRSAITRKTSRKSFSDVLCKDGSVAHIQLAPDERWRSQADLSRIDPAYVDALLAMKMNDFIGTG